MPGWARRERLDDLAWITENMYVFWPAARAGFAAVGRGAIIVDTTARPTGGGHPFGYLPAEIVGQSGDSDTIRMVTECGRFGQIAPSPRSSSSDLVMLPRLSVGRAAWPTGRVTFHSRKLSARLMRPLVPDRPPLCAPALASFLWHPGPKRRRLAAPVSPVCLLFRRRQVRNVRARF
jgi:hypothetical protein